MAKNKTILIWIGILILVGIILIMVACETGVLTPQQPVENIPGDTAGQNDSSVKPVDNPLGVTDQVLPQQEPVDEGPKTLTVGKPYSKKLVEEGSTNILIIGEDKVSSLYDTIGIASIDKKTKSVKLIMIPRDTYIEYNEDIINALDKAKLLHSPGVLKINYTHHVGTKINYEGRVD